VRTKKDLVVSRLTR